MGDTLHHLVTYGIRNNPKSLIPNPIPTSNTESRDTTPAAASSRSRITGVALGALGGTPLVVHALQIIVVFRILEHFHACTCEVVALTSMFLTPIGMLPNSSSDSDVWVSPVGPMNDFGGYHWRQMSPIIPDDGMDEMSSGERYWILETIRFKPIDSDILICIFSLVHLDIPFLTIRLKSIHPPQPNTIHPTRPKMASTSNSSTTNSSSLPSSTSTPRPSTTETLPAYTSTQNFYGAFNNSNKSLVQVFTRRNSSESSSSEKTAAKKAAVAASNAGKEPEGVQESERWICGILAREINVDWLGIIPRLYGNLQAASQIGWFVQPHWRRDAFGIIISEVH
ncbi:uncharacterized protein BDR25DRAFT_391665 [Lindgomyces ingoldianus]|uniref:Uncharacterized protein n=1 Tax=Lindgomyces ingoldianus TaxID=673940 RepID=A0ACB6R654_9PLEO|nr:uncharacterized protein BDR25DRAFT_391665 [Lindgomyces ingoldianus]KAF2474540.1 hypothetical protein BDR25DRAFT_391665 [Lindgomyces ingoldianus]